MGYVDGQIPFDMGLIWLFFDIRPLQIAAQ